MHASALAMSQPATVLRAVSAGFLKKQD